MKHFRLVTILGALALLLVLSTLSATAAGVTVNNTDPTVAPYIDSQTHTIAPSTSLWYKFDYAGDMSGIMITLPNGAANGLGFNVFTPLEATDWWEVAPIGRGTAQSGSDDLTWVGDFNAPGTYFVEVMNDTTSGMPFQLMIQGTGIALGTPAASQVGGAGAPAGAAPALQYTPTGPVANTDPGHAAMIDNQAHTIGATAAVWYMFNYAGDKSDITITLPNGALNGLQFNVWTTQEAQDWWDLQPVGRGTVQGQSNDLTWVGLFDLPGTYYVQVINTNANPMPAQLTIQGSGVALAQ